MSLQWDTAGQERFRGMMASYYRGGYGLMIVYDVSNRESFEMVETWHRECQLQCQGGAVLMILANKSELIPPARQVSRQEGAVLARRLGDIPFMECSCVTRDNIERAVELLIHEVKRSLDRELLIERKVGVVRRPVGVEEDEDVDLCTIM